MNCVRGKQYPRTTCILVKTKEDGVRLFQNDEGKHAEDFGIHYLRELSKTRLKLGPVTLIQNYAPCDGCTRKIKNFLSESTSKISRLRIRYMKKYEKKDDNEDIVQHEEFFTLREVPGVTVTVRQMPVACGDEWKESVKEELEDLFDELDPYKCNRSFLYDRAVDKSNLQVPDVEELEKMMAQIQL